MTIKEKIARIRAIPKRIAEIESDRSRLLEPKTCGFENTGASASSGGNGTEQANINYADEGKEIFELIKERQKLIYEVQLEINRTITGEDIKDIDMREVMKAHLLDERSLKFIASRIVHKNYTDTKKIYAEGCQRLGL